jgi:predicted membrane channel-forming protein YqfA (hemolysin III family)
MQLKLYVFSLFIFFKVQQKYHIFKNASLPKEKKLGLLIVKRLIRMDSYVAFCYPLEGCLEV